MPFLRFAIAQLSVRHPAAGLRLERHEAGDQFGIDPIRLGQSAPASPERLGLRRRELPRLDPRRLQAGPKPPFLAARGLEADQCIPADGDLLQIRMAVAQAMDVEPIARNVYPNDLWMCCGVPSLFLLYAVRVGRTQLFETMKRGGAGLLSTWSSHKVQVPCTAPSPALAKVGDGNAISHLRYTSTP